MHPAYYFLTAANIFLSLLNEYFLIATYVLLPHCTQITNSLMPQIITSLMSPNYNFLMSSSDYFPTAGILLFPESLQLITPHWH